MESVEFRQVIDFLEMCISHPVLLTVIVALSFLLGFLLIDKLLTWNDR